MTDFTEKKPKTLADFQLEEIDGEALLYSPTATRSIYLNPSAALIWQLCTGENSVKEIITALQTEFPDESKSIAEDVQKTIKDFSENQAIELI